MSRLALCLLSLIPISLTACAVDSPALGFGRASYQSVEIGGDSFKVYTEETRNCVEVHRVNFVFPPPSRLEIMLKAEKAAEMVTGCQIEKGSFEGDQAIQKGRLDCSAGSAAKDWVKGTCKRGPW